MRGSVYQAVYVKKGVLRAFECVHMHTGHRIIDKLDGLCSPTEKLTFNKSVEREKKKKAWGGGSQVGSGRKHSRPRKQSEQRPWGRSVSGQD